MDKKILTAKSMWIEDDPFGMKSSQNNHSSSCEEGKPFKLVKAAYYRLSQVGDDLFAREYSIKLALGFGL